MTPLQARAIVALFERLALADGHITHCHHTGHVPPADMRQLIDSTAAMMGLTRRELVARIETFRLALDGLGRPDMTDDEQEAAIFAVAERVTRDEPTGNPADFLGAIPEGPDAPGDARDL